MDQAILPEGQAPQKLLGEIRTLIDSARSNVARAANAGLVRLYWNVGWRIRQDILKENRAEYGERIVATLSQQLTWSHFVRIIPLKDPFKREFYSEMCRLERWSVSALKQKIGGMLFERTALSRKPAASRPMKKRPPCANKTRSRSHI